MNKKFLC